MKITKLITDLQNFAFKSDIKPEISGIHFHDGYAVATDASTLVQVKIPSHKSDGDEPIIPGKTHVTELPKMIIKMPKGLKELKQTKLMKDYLDGFFFTNNEENTIELTNTNLEETNSNMVRKIPGEFPDYQAIMPKDDTEWLAEITLDPERVMNLMKYFNDHREGFGGVTFRIQKADTKSKAILVESEDKNIKALIMPMIK